MENIPIGPQSMLSSEEIGMVKSLSVPKISGP